LFFLFDLKTVLFSKKYLLRKEGLYFFFSKKAC
jgi:hypothetical protein